MSSFDTLIGGAGPAGLTTAYELSKLRKQSLILEADKTVGGLSRTVDHDGFKFDIGGHRFFSKVQYVNELWREILGDDLIERPRLSRILYSGHYFDYPLTVRNALSGLGLLESARVCLSFGHSRLFPYASEDTLEQWVSNRFGHRLYEIFFRTYTEKVWGMSCTEISSDWAAQRIKNFSLVEALRAALLGRENGEDGQVITTLIEKFLYPRHGPGMMWEKCAELLTGRGSEIQLDRRIAEIRHTNGRVVGVTAYDGTGELHEYNVDNFVSSIPLRELILSMNPRPPENVIAAARLLRYRDYLTVVLIVDVEDVFPDNWIYIHDPDVKMGRIQNYKNWSPEMVPDQRKTALGLEYFLWQDDDEWSWDDERLIELGKRECEAMGLVDSAKVVDGTVVRMKKAYPVYDQEYHLYLRTIRDYCAGFENLQIVGRNGQHRYNNQDHSMMTGVLAARNIVKNETHDIWSVNTEKAYHEVESDQDTPGGDRLVPKPATVPELKETVISTVVSRVDAVALGAALGLTITLLVFLATAILLLKGGETVGQNLILLKQYLPFYTLTWLGAAMGSAQAGIAAFVVGYISATLRNLLIRAYLMSIRRRIGTEQNPDILEAV